MHRNLSTAFIIFFICLLFSLCLAQDSYDLERIIVRNTQGHYAQEIITAQEVKEKGLSSFVDSINYIPGIDLRWRGSFGIQGDLSLRGSTYEQVAVAIDGVRVMDPQTGHHNLDIPLTVFDLERIEVAKEAVSTEYGSGGFAGGINIVSKKPTRKVLNFDTLFGQNALFGQTVSFSLPGEKLSSRISFDHKVSKAARPNTDFEYKTASVYLNQESEKTDLDLLFGYQQKDFGADSFYSNLFPEEEEHTQTLFTRIGLSSRFDFGGLKENLFFRKHKDKFILNRNNPTSVNYHTTYIYGLNSQLDLPLKYGNLSPGMDIGEEEINSTNLGKHSRLYTAGSLGFAPDLGQRCSADLAFRFDHYQKWGTQESYHLALGYDLFPERLKIRGSIACAFRLPSFTELYYADSANIGNPDLKIEKSDNFRLGLNYKQEAIELGVDGFLRRGKNLIDWTRAASSDPWQATNLGRVDFRGLEFSAKIKPQLNFRGFNLEKLVFSYSYTSADKKTNGVFSKYALDILKHQYILEIDSRAFGLDFNWQLSYQQRYYAETYFVGSLYIGKKLEKGSLSFEPFVKIDNFSNAKYSEVGGVLQPGRWIQSGFRLEW